jgi:xylulokinase
LVATGGGARGDLWLRIKACVYDLPIATPETAESGLLGCGALAGIGAGVFEDAPGAVRRLVRLKAPILPDPALVERYARLREIFDDLYESSRAFDERLAGI